MIRPIRRLAEVVMKETLAEALSALFIEPAAAPAVLGATEEAPLSRPAASQAQQALDHYNQAVERLKSGDWKGASARSSTLCASFWRR
jgi:hypothetical protein